MIHEWDLTETNLHRLKNRHLEIAVLPVGAIEAHNLHLPEGQDFLHTSYIAKESCKCAWEKCQSVICLPALPFGVDCNLLDFPLTIHVAQATLDAMVKDIILSLHKHGIRKVVLINGHGGNDFTPLIRQLQCDIGSHIFLCDWWKVGLDKYGNIFQKPDDHAGEFETSVALALYPKLVEIDNARSGQTRPFRFKALQKGWVKTSRKFSKLNENCASGDPEGASPEKGQEYINIVVSRICEFLVQLAQSSVDELFPHRAE